MSLYLGNTIIAPNISNAANKSLSNLDSTGQGVLDGKANTALTNLTNGLSNTICTVTPTTISTASSVTPAVVIENYVNGTEWYRVWSDGWCEQGGAASMTTYTTFLKPYKDNNYGLFTQMSTNGYVDTYYNQVVYYRDNAGFTSNIYHGNNGIGFNWFACGYIS